MSRIHSRKLPLSFTPRQWDVIELARRDLSNRAIAEVLGISERTVEGQLAKARNRAGVATTRALLARAGARPRAPIDDVGSSPRGILRSSGVPVPG